jgi:hypothetical protein
MAKKSLNLTGTSGTTYDLDNIAAENRENSSKDLIVQIHEYNPNSADPTKRSPNPLKPKIGQIWLSKINRNL